MDQARAARLEMLLPLLACPTCRARLGREAEGLRCGACSRAYPIVEGRPAFLPGDGEMPRLMPPEKLSNQVVPEYVAMLESTPGWSLNIGAGGTERSIERCIELEYTIFRNTDVSSDAHALPFADDTFDAVVSFNTFEHLADPARAAGEIYRVLKPGGRLVLQTAFLQPLHEGPHHYYNATEFGLRRWFSAFEDAEISVPFNFQPAHVMAWVISENLKAAKTHLGEEVRDRMAAMTLGEWEHMWDWPATRGAPAYNALQGLPLEVQKGISAGFQISATKPVRTHTDGAARTYRPAFRRLARWWAEVGTSR